MLSPIECERWQTIPDNYTNGISKTQRYKCIGNGWTVDVIANIFKYIYFKIQKKKRKGKREENIIMEKEKAKSDNTKNYKYPLKLKSKEELYEYLRNVNMEEKRENPMCSVYFLVEYKEKAKDKDKLLTIQEPIYFFPYDTVYFESPCRLLEWPMTEEELEKFVHNMYEEDYWEEAYKYEKIFQRGNNHYEIDAPQCLPFLPNEIKIVKMLSESECLDFLING